MRRGQNGFVTEAHSDSQEPVGRRESATYHQDIHAHPGSTVYAVAHGGMRVHGEHAASRAGESAGPADAIREATEDLATAVGRQWRAEEERRILLYPRPLSLRWAAVSPDVPAAHDPQAPMPGEYPLNSPAGQVDQFAAILHGQVHPARLLILGAAGAGKTVTAIRLVGDLIGLRRNGSPVPVLFTLGTWDPSSQRLPDWLAERLARDHPGLLADVRFATGHKKSLAAALLDSGRILPVLDGFDHISAELRAEAVRAVNRLGPDIPLIVTSRAAEYREATLLAGRGLVQMAAVELQPLDLTDVESYLAGATSGGHGAEPARWRDVLRELRSNSDGPLAQAMRTPLMAWLAHIVYSDPAANPAELCDGIMLPGRAAIEDHLLGHFVGAAYPGHPAPSGQRTRPLDACDAAEYHGFLARHLKMTGTQELCWWQLHQSMPWVDLACRVAMGFAAGFGFGSMAGIHSGMIYGTALGLLSMSSRALSMIGAKEINSRIHKFRFSRRRLRGLLRYLFLRLAVAGVGVCLFGIPVSILGGPWNLGLAWLIVLAAVSLLGLIILVWCIVRLRHGTPSDSHIVVAADLNRAVSPVHTFREDRAVALVGAIPFIVFSAFVSFWLRFELFIGPSVAVGWLMSSAYARFSITRTVLAVRGRLPWRTMSFLDDACRRGVLRQFGAVYEYRHERLRDRLTGAVTGDR